MSDKTDRNKGASLDKGKKLVNGTLIYAIGNFGTKIIAFLIVPLYTYYISTSDMGDYDILITTISLLTPIITLRISDAAYRWMLHKIQPAKDCISSTYRILLTSSILTTIIVIGINQIHTIQYCYYFIALLILGRWLESLQTLLRGLNKQKLFAASGIIYTLTYVVINLIKIVYLKQGVTALFEGTIISQILNIIIIMVATPEFRIVIINDKANKQLTRDMLKYSAPLVPSGLSWWVMGASDRYVIRYILGRSATGIYSVANKFPTIISTLFVVFNNSWTDLALSDLSEGEETSEYTSKLFKRLYVFSFSCCLVLIPITKILTYYLLSNSYKSASLYIGFLYIGAVFQGFTTFISAGLLQGTKTVSVAKSSTIGAVVNIIIDIIFISRIGIFAASISTFLGYFVMWLSRMYDIRTISPVRIDKIQFCIYLILSTAFAVATIFSKMWMDIVLTIIGLFIFFYKNGYLISGISRKLRH